jgi:hypothetical protein
MPHFRPQREMHPTVLSGLASGAKWQYNRLKYGESQADQPVSFD